MTPSTITFDRGSVVLVPFAYTDQTQVKRRPAVVISTAAYHTGRQEVIVAAVTTRIRPLPLPGDCVLTDWRQAGLVSPSVVTAILQTIKQNRIERVLGKLSPADLAALDQTLAPILDFRPV